MKSIHYILILLLFLSCKSDYVSKKTINELADIHIIPAWAYLSWEHGKIQQYYYKGYTLFDDSTAITEDTYFEAASLSKTIFSGLVLDYFRLNKISLDSVLVINANRRRSENEYDRRIKSSIDYRINPSKQSPTARKILTHTANFGDWMTPELFLESTESGSFNYSGEGFLYLQRWIEERENKQIDSVEGFQFMNSEAMDFSLSTNIRNIVWGHNGNLKAVRPIWYSDYPYVHGTLCCKPKAFANWWLSYMEKPDSNLLNCQYNIDSTNARTAGLGLIETEFYELLWQHGNDTYFQNLFVHDKNTSSGFVVFTNSQNGFQFINEILGERFKKINLAVSSNGLFLISD